MYRGISYNISTVLVSNNCIFTLLSPKLPNPGYVSVSVFYFILLYSLAKKTL